MQSPVISSPIHCPLSLTGECHATPPTSARDHGCHRSSCLVASQIWTFRCPRRPRHGDLGNPPANPVAFALISHTIAFNFLRQCCAKFPACISHSEKKKRSRGHGCPVYFVKVSKFGVCTIYSHPHSYFHYKRARLYQHQ